MISDDILNKINDETDLVALVSEYVSLERVGKNYRGLCPFHDDNSPSFYVTPEKNIAKCMSCGEGGRPVNFLRLIKNISFAEAAEELGERLGITVFKEKKQKDPNTILYEIMSKAAAFYTLNLFNSESGQIVIKYLQKRKISIDTMKEFNLGFAPNDSDILYQYLKELNYSVSDMIKLGLVNQASDGTYYDFFKNRLIFPITDQYQRIVGFSARTLSKNEKSKYINSPETPIFKKTEILYNLGEASLDIRRLKKVYIFEGFFDVISAHQEGIKNTVATMGTALTNNHINSIKQLTNNVLLAFDGDEAGINSVLKHLPSLDNKLSTEVVLIPDKMDPDDYFKNYCPDAFLKLVQDEALDSYEFRYNYFLNKTNFNNANDIKTFETNVTKMLVSANNAVISLYKKRLSEKLNISIDNIIVKKSSELAPLEPKEAKQKLENRYIVAEQRLFILMLRSSVWSERITNMLTIHEYGNSTLSNLRAKIGSYYLYTNEFILSDFKQTLNNDELNYFETKVQKDKYWINQVILSDEEINKYVKLLKETPTIRRIAYLKELMVEKQAKGLSFKKENEELKMLTSKRKQFKEEV